MKKLLMVMYRPVIKEKFDQMLQFIKFDYIIQVEVVCKIDLNCWDDVTIFR